MGKSATSFKKGHKPVSPGRPPLPADIRAARNLSYEEMCRTVIQVREMTTAELKQIDLEQVPLGKRMIINAYAKMDFRGVQIYEDRLWGKAKERVELTGADGAPIGIDILRQRIIEKLTGNVNSEGNTQQPSVS